MGNSIKPPRPTQRMVTLILTMAEFYELVDVLKSVEAHEEAGRKKAIDARMQLHRLEQKTGLKLRK